MAQQPDARQRLDGFGDRAPGTGGPDSRWVLTDSHCHLGAEEFGAGELQAVLKRAYLAGVGRLVTVGLDVATSRAAVAIAARHAGVWAAVGIAPNDLDGYGPLALAELAELTRQPRVVAIGEIGLDYHWRPETAERQRQAFAAQLALAGQAGLPVIVHSRDADADVQAMLLDWALSKPMARPPYGVLHCYSSDVDRAQVYAEAGFLISLSGVVTYPRAYRTKAVARELDLAALLLETDAPYLAPQAHRGRRNEPAFLVATAACVAELRGTDVGSLACATSSNAERLFRLPAGNDALLTTVDEALA